MENVNKNNHKLIIGIILGIIFGLLIAFYLLDYLPLTISHLISGVLILFTSISIILIILIWNRDRIIKKLFGDNIEFDDSLNDFKSTIEISSNLILDSIQIKHENKNKLKTILPRIFSFFIWSTFRNWGLRLIITIFAIISALLGSVLLYNQNELLSLQNNKIEIQTNLEEANRRSTLMFLMGDIMNQITIEIKDKEKRNFGAELYGRIITLSESFRPYRFLEGDTLISPATSPERGQLLIYLVNIELDSMLLNSLLQNTNFKFSYLKGFDLDSLDIVGVDFSDSNFEEAIISNSKINLSVFNDSKMYFSKFNNSIIDSVTFYRCDLEFARFFDITANNLDFLRSNLHESKFKNAKILNSSFNSANLSGSNFQYSTLVNIDFQDSKLNDVDFAFAKFENVNNLTFDQLKTVFTLYKCSGLSDTMEIQLMNENPKLFDPPWYVLSSPIYNEND